LRERTISTKVRHGRGAQKRREEADQPNDHRLFPLGAEDAGIEFCPGQKREHDGAGPRQKATQADFAPSTSVPISAPMTSCATVPTTISESAVEILNQIDSSVAINASMSHSAAENQTCSITGLRYSNFLLYRDSAWKPLQRFCYRSHWPLGKRRFGELHRLIREYSKRAGMLQ
jgi:hypothetical protein